MANPDIYKAHPLCYWNSLPSQGFWKQTFQDSSGPLFLGEIQISGKNCLSPLQLASESQLSQSSSSPLFILDSSSLLLAPLLIRWLTPSPWLIPWGVWAPGHCPSQAEVAVLPSYHQNWAKNSQGGTKVDLLHAPHIPPYSHILYQQSYLF